MSRGTRPVDWLAAFALLLVAEFEIWVEPIFEAGLPGPRPALAVIVAAAILPLVWRRRFPLGALAASAAGLLLVGAVAAPEQSAFELLLALLLATYSVAGCGSGWEAAAGAAIVLAGGAVYEWLTWVEGDAAVDVAVPYLLLAAAWVAGREVANHRARAASLEAARDREASLAVAEERTRIARELHDVVAHGISLMGIQAAAARRTDDRAAQEESLLAVERAGREALAEMHRMLGVLRANGDAGGRSPLPGLAAISELVEEARRAGARVELAVEGEPRPLPAGLELSAYRIAQEALTNARKHAPGAAVHVRLRYGDDALELAVADDGPGPPATGRAGHGLIGMRERAAMHRGELRAGPGERGGFVVEARLAVDG